MAERTAPIFLLAGGRAMRERHGPDPLLQAVFACTGVSRPSIAYIGAASGDDGEFRRLIAGRLEKAGAGKVALAPLCGKRGDTSKATAVLEDSDVVFLSGGDVEAGMRILNENGMAEILSGLYRAGKPFFGVSAGSIMLARQWIRWTDPDNDASSELFDCLGLAPVLCDTHGEDDDWQELNALLNLSPVGAVGHGISSGAALLIEPDGEISALGGEVHRFRRLAGGVMPIKGLAPA